MDVVRRDFQELALWSRDGGAEWVTDDIIEVENQDGSEFGEYIHLLGYDVQEDELSPGNRLELTLYWEAEGSAERYWSVFVHLVDRNGIWGTYHPIDGDIAKQGHLLLDRIQERSLTPSDDRVRPNADRPQFLH